MLKFSLHRFFSWQAVGSIALCLALILPQAGLAQSQNPPAAENSPFQRNVIASPPPPLVPRAFLPLVCKLCGAGIFGFVTQAGLPAANVTLNLRKIDTGVTVIVGTAITDINGYYQFSNADALSTGQTYQVVYQFSYGTNDSISGRLASWTTKTISPYAQGQSINIGDFDITDVAQTNPASSDVSIPLPRTFSWQRRINSPTDSYQIKIVDYTNPPPLYTEKFTSPALGYLDQFTFQTLDWPAGMVYGYTYYWYVIVHAPDSSSGASRYIWHINFLSTP
jgi:hypothetical protein